MDGGEGIDKKKREEDEKAEKKGKCARKMPEGAVRGLAQNNNVHFFSGHTDTNRQAI